MGPFKHLKQTRAVKSIPVALSHYELKYSPDILLFVLDIGRPITCLILLVLVSS